MQQAYVSSAHQMAPPSPNTNSSSNSSSGGGEHLSKTNLYIRGLHPGTTDQDLVKLCQPLFNLRQEACRFLSGSLACILSVF
ncbi:RNA binding motif, single stranded interacting protein 3 [Ataeniobius toweri]|uniref:RNA binding motif, single stranded interacting protein 3 n=1 Tax=Ataeniobius toweri TaxID=208326 RepID=A0ABU7BR69_9TELE|nr:RNA binding motif, single stranded interacting protein 3 [Ataeniobius toweri]